jgi:cyclic pyranopterin phosphate synthase
VLDGIDAAAAAGLPVKVNMVVRRGLNEHSVLPMAREFRERGHILRLIEYMDVGHTNGWRLDDVVPASELVAMIDAELPLEAAEANYRGEVARRYRYRDGSGEVAHRVVTQPPAAMHARAALRRRPLYTCLFATKGHDLRAPTRALGRRLRGDRRVWLARGDRYLESAPRSGGAQVECRSSGLIRGRFRACRPDG